MLGVHIDYLGLHNEMQRWRDAYEGGDNFVQRYLEKYSDKEADADFQLRRKRAYCPNLCAAAINEYLNRFVSGLSKVTRKGNATYLQQLQGKGGGVTGHGDKMDMFLAEEVLKELMPMGRVGIFVDNFREVGETLADQNSRPYFVLYRREQIKNWRYDHLGLSHLHLEYKTQTYDDDGFPKGTADRELKLIRREGFVEYQELEGDSEVNSGRLELPRIPFVDLWISTPLMRDIVNHQIALLNIESSDVQYILEANFPFLVQQFEKTYQYQRMLSEQDEEFREYNNDNATHEAAHGKEDAKGEHLGHNRGMVYGRNLNAPAFIHPSSEPLTASMKKQEQIEQQIRKILMLSLINMQGVSASQQSRSEANQTVESGLYVLGQVLERAEQELAEIWAMYMGVEPATITYPTRYAILTEEEINQIVKRYRDTLTLVPSRTYQMEIAMEVVNNLLPHLTYEQFSKIEKELSEFTTLVADPDIVRENVEQGLLSHQLGAKLNLYPPEDLAVAKEEHIQRLKEIQAAQTPVEVVRGVDDSASEGDNTAKDDKEGKPQRGDGKNITAKPGDDD